VKALLVITAIVEVGAGAALVTAPSTLARLLLGRPLDTPAAVAVARIAGVALLALTTACWSARIDVASRAARGIVAAMLLYNCGAVAVLVHSAASGRQGVGLWPTAVVHAGLALWCLTCVRMPAHVATHSASNERRETFDEPQT
jgi:hypothetical protein